jgi:hypothetical protein
MLLVVSRDEIGEKYSGIYPYGEYVEGDVYLHSVP